MPRRRNHRLAHIRRTHLRVNDYAPFQPQEEIDCEVGHVIERNTIGRSLLYHLLGSYLGGFNCHRVVCHRVAKRVRGVLQF